VNILDLLKTFQTQEQAVEYLETVRWHGTPVCPYCGSISVGRHASGDRKGQRWQCRDCTRAFAVTVGTIFHGTHIELKNWFLVIALMLNAKKSASAYQIARDLGMRRPTVWSMMHRVRTAMAEDTNQSQLLHGIVEADEVYIGGKPRKRNKRDDDTPNKRGRGTKKIPVAGVVQRGGRVIAKPAARRGLTSKGLLKFISRFVSPNGAIAYAYALTDANTIEGFRSLVKRAWYGSHHHFSRKYMELSISEAAYKYNRRGTDYAFGWTIQKMVGARA
jgi:transposase-like protein